MLGDAAAFTQLGISQWYQIKLRNVRAAVMFIVGHCSAVSDKTTQCESSSAWMLQTRHQQWGGRLMNVRCSSADN